MAYHHSDEISLVFLAANPLPGEARDDEGRLIPAAASADEDADLGAAADEGDGQVQTKGNKKKGNKKEPAPRSHPYAGRVQKLASVTAAYATARLNRHLAARDWGDLPERVRRRVLAGEAIFDGRVVATPDLAAAADCVLWRSAFDGFRNAVSAVAQARLPSAALPGASLPRLLDALYARGVDVWSEFPERYLFGTWLKREAYTAPLAVAGLPARAASAAAAAGRPLPDAVVRRRVRQGSFNWADYTPEDRCCFVAARYWPAAGPGAPPMDPLPDAPPAEDEDADADALPAPPTASGDVAGGRTN
ncbi:hypothetical protein HK405_014629 [Cladochytrium tenue]|nr:hypothetical protein HK405_014629 [Cladochytrium tenue]